MSRPRILIVDDDPGVREAVSTLLALEGYDLDVASNGQEALAQADAAPPDVVLLDVLMPGMDGFEVCRRLRGDPARAGVLIVLITMLSSKEDLVRGLDAGADDFLSKPVNGMELRARVRSMLRIKRQHDDLQAKHAELYLVQRQKQELMAMIVHDLKSPLFSMIIMTESSAQDPAVSAEARAALKNVADLGRTIDRMILDLLDVSRSDDGALVARKKPVILKELARAVCAALKVRADAKQISLAAEVTEVVADADPGLLRRILENLVDNAIKYAPPDSEIRVSAAATAEGALIKVCDQGPGVPPDDRERIFERFVRLERDAERHSRISTGLGLAFCRVAAEAHGGRIWVQDNAPIGTCFCVALPSAPPSRIRGE